MSAAFDLFIASFIISIVLFKVKNKILNWPIIIKNTFYTWILALVLTLLFHIKF